MSVRSGQRRCSAQGYLDFVMVSGGTAGGGGVPELAEIGVGREENAVWLRGGGRGHGRCGGGGGGSGPS
jgi:hypothetical protein